MTQLTLIHGDDIAKSREALLQEKSVHENSEFITLAGNTMTMTDLVLSCETTSLFTQNKCIVIENLLKGGKGANKQILEYIKSDKCIYPIIIWEDRKLEANSLRRSFPGARVIVCNYPASLFTFLDSLGISTPQQLLSLFQQVLAEKDAMLVLTMLFRQIRLLIIAKDSPRLLNEIGVAPWQGGKLASQAGIWDQNKLIDSYRQLIAIDYRIKSGQTPYTPAQLLDFWLATL